MKTAIITGCNRGLGNALLARFAKLKWNIIACTRTQNDDYVKFCEKLQAENNIVIYNIHADFSDKCSLKVCLQEIESLNVPVDLLVNNAGIHINATVFNLEYEDIETCFRINYYAPFMFCKKAAEIMIHNSGGSIVNISSYLSVIPMKGGSGYAASKAALNCLTKTLSLELAPFGIRVNTVCCGDLEDGMFANLNDKVKKEHLKRNPMKRTGKFEEVCDAVEFLASDRSTYINGDTLRVDGGVS